MTLKKAIKLLEVHYEAAKKLEWVQKPLAFALHQVWRMADTEKTTEKGGAKMDGGAT